MTDQNEPRPEPPADPVQPLPDPDSPTDAGTPPDPAAGSAGRPDSRTRTRLRDRVLGIRGIAAVTVAGLILGGLGGAAVGAALEGGDHHRGPGGHGFVEQGRGPDQQGRPGPPPAGRPVLPPGTSPQQDDDQPSSSGDTTSGSDT